MNGLAALFFGSWLERLGWVLIHFLWQGAGIALLLAVALRLLARTSSHVRYVVIGSALLLCAVMPVVTWAVLRPIAQPETPSATAFHRIDVPHVEAPLALSSAWSPVIAPASPINAPTRWQDNFSRLVNASLPYVVDLWFAGVLILTLRLTLVWTLMRRLCLSGLPIQDAGCLERFRSLLARMQVVVPVRLLESALVEVPTLIGWLRPTILVPASVFMGLTPDQLDAILAHELAHVRRYDYLVNLFQTVIETVLFYHPAVWWISRKLREERENCCDDIALEVMQDRLVYVSALALLEEGRVTPPALAASGGSLVQRIRRIVGEGASSHAMGLPAILAVLSLCAALTVASLLKAQYSSVPATQAAMSAAGAKQKGIAALVNHKPIYWADVDYYRLSPEPYLRTKYSGDMLKQKMAEAMAFRAQNDIDRELVIESFDASKDPFRPSQVQARIDFGIKGFRGDKNAFVKNLEKNGMTLERFAERDREDEICAHMEDLKVYGPTEAYMRSQHFPPTTDPQVVQKQRQALFAAEIRKLRHEWMQELWSKAVIQRFDGPETPSDGNKTSIEAGSPSTTSNKPAGDPTLAKAMHAAAQKGDAVTAQKLIDQGADPKAIDQYGNTLLFIAGSPEVAEMLIANGVDPKVRNSSDITALSSLCLNGGKNTAAIARVLLQHGADPNSRDGELKTTPIMGARDGDTVDVLVQYGADLKTLDSTGNNALFWSTWMDISTFEALLRHGFPFGAKTDGPTVLLHATWNHNLPLVAWLLAHDVDPNSPGVWVHNHGRPDAMMTPICATAISGQPEAAKLLLEHGAKGEEATRLALQNHYSNIVKILWEHGVRNISELCYALSQNAPLGDLEKILQSGAPVDPPRDEIVTPLGEAAETDNLPAVQLLVQHGADVNKGGNPVAEHSEYHDTPLKLAAERGQDEIVAFLLQHGAQANPDVASGAGNAGIPNSFYAGKDHLPSREHYERVMQMLIDAGALKNIAPEWTGRLLSEALSPCWGDPDPIVLQKLLAAGLRPEVPMPNLKEIGEKPNSVIGYFREYYQKNKDNPSYGRRLAAFKPLLDMLEAADKGPASKISDKTTSLESAALAPALVAAKKGNEAGVAETSPAPNPPDAAPTKTLIVHVQDSAGKPIEGAVFHPRMLLGKKEGALYGDNWTPVPAGTPWPRQTDQQGNVAIDYPAQVNREGPTQYLTLMVEHPGYVAQTASIKLEQLQPVVLARGTKLTVHMIPPPGVSLTRAACQIKQGDLDPSVITWTADSEPGTESAYVSTGACEVRAVAFDAGNQAYFGPCQMLKVTSTQDIHLDFKVTAARAIQGMLDPSLPRPIRNGYVQATVSAYSPSHLLNPINWTSSASVAEDGSFLLTNLPPGYVEVIALCRGYISRAPAPTRTWELASVRAQLAGDSLAKSITVAMEPTGTARVKVLTPEGKPLANAKVVFHPQESFHAFSTFLAGKIDTVQLSQDWDTSLADQLLHVFVPNDDFQATTDADGVATVSNLPPGDQICWVMSDAYQMPVRVPEETPNNTVRDVMISIKPGELATAQIQLVHLDSEALLLPLSPATKKTPASLTGVVLPVSTPAAMAGRGAEGNVGPVKDAALQEAHILSEVAHLKSELHLTPAQEAVLKTTMESVVRACISNTPIVKTVDQALKEILNPQQELAWEEIKEESPKVEAELAATNETVSAARLLHLNAAQKDKVWTALYQIALDAQTRMKSIRSPFELASAFETEAQAKEIALAKILTPDQYAIYTQYIQNDVHRQEVAMSLTPAPTPALRFAPTATPALSDLGNLKEASLQYSLR